MYVFLSFSINWTLEKHVFQAFKETKFNNTYGQIQQTGSELCSWTWAFPHLSGLENLLQSDPYEQEITVH